MPTPRETWDLAGALLDREPVDWSRFEREGSTDRRALVASLRSLARLTAGSSQTRLDDRSAPLRAGVPALAVVAIAAIHVLLAIAGFALGHAGNSPVPAGGSALVVIVFFASAVWLFAGGRRDTRAWSLGAFYVLIAAAFSRRFLGVAAGTPLDAITAGVFPEAFLPAFLWSFVRRFPRVLRFSAADRFCRAALRISVAAGILLAGANLCLTYVSDVPVSHLVHRSHSSGLYWAIVLGLCTAALPAIVIRARLAPPDERRRVAFFCGAVLLSVLPLALEMFAEITLPSFSASMDRPEVRRGASYAMFAILLALPVATAYSVVVERVLDVRVVVGRALQYLLARGTLAMISVVPFALLVAYGSRNRDMTLGELFAGRTGVAALALMAAGLLLLSSRHRLLSFVDRVFMRTAVDFAGEMTRLTGDLSHTRSATESLELVERAIERVTGAASVRVYLHQKEARSFVPTLGSGDPLPVDSACAALLREDASPLAVGAAETGTLSALLPPEDTRWIAETGSAVLVPVVRTGESLSGFISVGPKRNGLPYSSQELTYLSGVSSAAALATAQYAAGAGVPPHDDHPARECLSCGRMSGVSVAICACGGPTRVAALPEVLDGKFRVERRVGAGGMGVVYRAVDSTLDRPVALKTLSRLSPAAAGRLAQEARVMAAVVHPHLATIYGVERWRATPVLVVEYCEQGTLGDRLRTERLTFPGALRLGLNLTRALEELHAAGVLHRDVKPSNIGFLGNGSVKLLDFGIASYAAGATSAAAADDDAGSRHTQTIDIRGRSIAGTPLYISPEILRGLEADARGDLWALALVMYEALAGRHPFAAATVPEVLSRVRKARVPDLRELRPDCPEAVARAFRRWLAREPSERPQTAAALAAEIEPLLVISS